MARQIPNGPSAEPCWFVGAYDLNAAGLTSLTEEIGEDNGLFQTLDVTDRKAVLSAVARFGGATESILGILFKNAGIIADGLFVDQFWGHCQRKRYCECMKADWFILLVSAL
jgi:NAD(P)-dependent dehydrogenase (short-subunit alcohol dehydrogenase family)